MYEWYRRSAQRRGVIHISTMDVPASKVGGIRYVDVTQFKKALRAHRNERAAIAQATRDIRRGIIHGGMGTPSKSTAAFMNCMGPSDSRSPITNGTGNGAMELGTAINATSLL